MRRTGSTTNANRIMIHGTPDPLLSQYYWNSYYSFQYTADGRYSVYKRVGGGSSVPLQRWTISPAIVTGANWNTLRVVASGGQLRFYINGSLVWSGTDYSLSYGRVGFGMYTTDVTDMLEIDWATLTPSAVLGPVTISPEQQALNDAANGQSGPDENGVP
jgi:hypothetical protein